MKEPVELQCHGVETIETDRYIGLSADIDLLNMADIRIFTDILLCLSTA